MLDRSSELCPELVGMFERAQKTAQSIVKQLHQQMEASLRMYGSEFENLYFPAQSWLRGRSCPIDLIMFDDLMYAS